MILPVILQETITQTKFCNLCSCEVSLSLFSKKNPKQCRKCLNTQTAAWKRENSDYYKEYTRQYRNKTKAQKAARQSSRRANKRKQTPIWVDLEERFLIAEAYHLSKLRTDLMGFVWHVDHIIPLKNSLICGLHIISNLQVISGLDNNRKYNKFVI